MGIKGLWTVLSPYSEKKSLHEIRGETIAVDLSGWVCDSQNVADHYIQPRLYLRTMYLLLAEVNPIFVLEGDAPELKRDVMAVRNAIQFRGAAPKADTGINKKPDIARRRFKGVLKECELLLKCMGVRCIKGHGEAEATCAQLNAQGLVNAVISQDSDCFAYGARRVYRNFSVSSAAGGGAMQGSIECYDADKMFHENGFGRNKMIALAILCGCDYAIGACGSSINTVISFLHSVPDKDIMPRLLSWESDPEYYEEKKRWISVPGRCERCGHAGRTHGKNGCPVCATHRGCNDTGHKLKMTEVKRELSLRARALSCNMPFPEPEVMKEFLKSSPEKINIDDLKIQSPSLIQFVKLMSSKLDWSERYCVEKFLPLLTKWHLQDNIICRTIKPVKIKKKRNPKGVPSYEVIWSDIDGQYDALIPDGQFEEGEDAALPWTSIERQDLMQQYYPSLVQAYEESIKKPSKVKKIRKKKDINDAEKPKRKYNKKANKNCTTDNKSSENIILKGTDHNSTKVSVKVNKLKRKLKHTPKIKGQKTIDSFISNKRRKSSKALQSLRRSFRRMSILKHGKENNNGDLLGMLNMSEDVIDDVNLSEIVDKIVADAPETVTAEVHNNLVKLVFDNKSSIRRKSYLTKGVLNVMHNNCSTPKNSPIRKGSFIIGNESNLSLNSKDGRCYSSENKSTKIRISSFFDKLTEDCDAFELSVDHIHNKSKTKSSSIINLDCDATVDYSLPNVCL